jgi:hypothetical protein
MIHPNTEVRWVSTELGYGVFATARIPIGTIVYAWDPLEIEIEPGDPRLTAPAMASFIERYSYVDPRGVRVVSWDNAKYVNHSCKPNSMSTGYGFEVAVRDIERGEEITDEYGMFNLPAPMKVTCCASGCRNIVSGDDLEKYHADWDAVVRAALMSVHDVEQPLWPLLDRGVRSELATFLDTPEGYVSVRTLSTNAHPTEEIPSRGRR